MSKSFTITEEMKKYLLDRQWQGNVRELENFIYRTAVLSTDGQLRVPEDEVFYEEKKIIKSWQNKGCRKRSNNRCP